MRTYGALFDLDGVLIDSEGTYTEFWRDIDRRYPTGVDDFATSIKGTTLESISKFFPDEDVWADITSRLRHFQDTMEFPLYPGVTEFLQSLADAGWRMALVTSSDPRKMERLWAQVPELKGFFIEVIDGKKVTRSKPHPEGYLKAAEAVGLDATDCFVFEDSLQGLKAGRASGATVIGISTTYPAEAIAPLADRVVPSVACLTPTELAAMK